MLYHFGWSWSNKIQIAESILCFGTWYKLFRGRDDFILVNFFVLSTFPKFYFSRFFLQIVWVWPNCPRTWSVNSMHPNTCEFSNSNGTCIQNTEKIFPCFIDSVSWGSAPEDRCPPKVRSSNSSPMTGQWLFTCCYSFCVVTWNIESYIDEYDMFYSLHFHR